MIPGQKRPNTLSSDGPIPPQTALQFHQNRIGDHPAGIARLGLMACAHLDLSGAQLTLLPPPVLLDSVPLLVDTDHRQRPKFPLGLLVLLGLGHQ